jgi:hypothetical protein
VRRPAVLVVAAAFGAALLVTLWLVREMRLAASTSGTVARPAPEASAAGGPLAAPSSPDAHLGRATATPGAPGRLEGTVTGATGLPLGGATVRLASRGDGAAGLQAVAVRTGADGRFAFDGVEPGRAAISATQDGVALGVSRAVHVQAGRPATVELQVAPSGVLEGRVGGGAGGTAVVVASPLLAGPGGLEVARAPVAGDGSFTLSLPGGAYRVLAAPAGAAAADLRATPTFISVVPGRSQRLDLSVAAPTAEPGVVVAVQEPGGAPSPGATVAVSRPGETRVAYAAAAGEDGRLTIARAMGLAGQPVALSVRNGGRTGAFSGTWPEAGEVAVRLRPGGAVEGRVLSGAPVTGFVLTVEVEPAPGGWRTLETRQVAGDRLAVTDLPPEPVRISARTADGRAGQAEVKAGPGEVVKVELALKAGATASRP